MLRVPLAIIEFFVDPCINFKEPCSRPVVLFPNRTPLQKAGNSYWPTMIEPLSSYQQLSEAMSKPCEGTYTASPLPLAKRLPLLSTPKVRPLLTPRSKSKARRVCFFFVFIMPGLRDYFGGYSRVMILNSVRHTRQIRSAWATVCDCSSCSQLFLGAATPDTRRPCLRF